MRDVVTGYTTAWRRERRQVYRHGSLRTLVTKTLQYQVKLGNVIGTNSCRS